MIQRTKEVQVRRITTKKAILNRRLVDLNRSGRRQHEALEKAGKARRSVRILFIGDRVITASLLGMAATGQSAPCLSYRRIRPRLKRC